MKKFICAISIFFMVCLCACNNDPHLPENGIWYCEDLKMEINFDLYSTMNNCVTVYDEKITFCDLLTEHHGSRIYIREVNEPLNMYLSGNYKFDDNVFKIVTFNGEVYSFLLRE